MPPEATAASTPPVLLVHGAWHGAWCWERQFAPWLRQQGHVVETLDLPGHGHPGPQRIALYPVRAYVDAVAARLAQSPRPMVVAGHSMGGFVVQKLMERRPAKLAGAALFASVPPQGVLGVVLHLLRSRPLDFLRSVTRLDLYHLVRTPQFAQALFYNAGLDAKTVEAYWQPLQNESFRAFLDMLVLDLPRSRRVDPALPNWIVGGELDRIFPPAEVRATAKAYGVEAKLYSGMAHNLMLDRGWETVAADFSSWLHGIRKK
ncbi:alpha/beta hydrolase [Stagnimonas aquatica]|uniref:alpha/beta hydrolase n=1 Tax=Stagnimonas aquatica TaxID=2689987 RepID=UPI00131585A0|nr:alpha/beta fold hydrolase [Stagnimonas aquatica]